MLGAAATVSVWVRPPSAMAAGWSKVMVCTATPEVANERMAPVRMPSVSEPAFVVPATRKF